MINKKIVSLILLIAFLSTGCVKIKTSNSQQNSKGQPVNLGGVFKSEDKGSVWKNKSLIANVESRPLNFSDKDIYSFEIDPSDSATIYFGSGGSGLYMTNDFGTSWKYVKSLGKIQVRDISVNHKNKCIIYVATGNKVMRTKDCTRTWEQVYIDNEKKVNVNVVETDHFNDGYVFIGLSRGDVLKSVNEGESWQAIDRVSNAIEKIVFDPVDSRNAYLVTANKSVHRTLDGGVTWETLAPKLRGLKLGADLRDLVIVEKDGKSVIYLAAVYGLAISEDLGETWTKIELLPPDQKARINSIAVNPVNSDEIYYVTNTTFYKTVDGGSNWTPSKLPSIRAGWKLLIDFNKPNIIYMGVKNLQK